MWLGLILVAIVTVHACRCGPLIDLCRGPHVRHTGKIKAATITKVSFGGTYS